MPKLSENSRSDDPAPAAASSPPELAATVARAKWLMLISALTTAIAIAAVAGVIGYRLFAAGGSGTATIVNGTVFLPPEAHVQSTTVADGQIVVTLDIGGTSEVRIFDLKTLKQTGQLQFTTKH